MKPVKDFLLFIGGFSQDRTQATIGSCGMARTAFHRYKDRGVCVDYETWNTDWRATAEWIFRWADGNGDSDYQFPPRIMVVAYSWGGGFGLIQLAKHLAQRNLAIDCAVCSDIVRHVGPGWFHRIGLAQVLAYNRYWKIKRPQNIKYLDWLIQGSEPDWFDRTTWLHGHPIIQRDADGKWIESPNKVIIPWARHTSMDDVPEFRRLVFQRADEIFGQKSADGPQPIGPERIRPSTGSGQNDIP